MYVVDIKNSRYSIDDDLAQAICLIEPVEAGKGEIMERSVV
jgi:hypothetical protein